MKYKKQSQLKDVNTQGASWDEGTRYYKQIKDRMSTEQASVLI